MFSNQASNLPGGAGADGQNNGSNPLYSSSSTSNDFVGQNIILGNHKLRIARLIAEGGFAIVYLAVDTTTGQEFALKRIFSADDVSNKQIREEIGYLVSLSVKHAKYQFYPFSGKNSMFSACFF